MATDGHALSTWVPATGLVIVALHVVALLAEPLAPYGVDEQHRELPYAPPTRLHLIDTAGHLHGTPFVYPVEPAPGGRLDEYRENHDRPAPVRWFPRGSPYRLAGLFTGDRHLFGVDQPGRIFLLGTDRYGRDLFSRLLVGARLSLFAGLIATTLALAIGLLVGSVAGYYGGWTDDALTWAADLCLSLPSVYLLLAVRSLLPLTLDPVRAFMLTATLIGVIGWARPSRLVRAVVITERRRDYVEAARSCGATEWRVLVRHVLPRTAPVLLTLAAMMAPRFVLAEITLSFLGLGVAEPAPSWGTLTAAMLPPGLLLAHWWLASPLVAIIGVVALYQRAARDLEAAPESGPARRPFSAEVG